MSASFVILFTNIGPLCQIKKQFRPAAPDHNNACATQPNQSLIPWVSNEWKLNPSKKKNVSMWLPLQTR